MASKIHLHALFFSFFLLGIHATTITVKNNCGRTIWPATLTGVGAGASTTGFELAPQAMKQVQVASNWNSGRIWARPGCSNNGGKLICSIGGCDNGLECNGGGGNAPVTLVEFTLNGDSNLDRYDISLVDGFNLPVKVTPSNGSCMPKNCPKNINIECPRELSLPGRCQSACLRFLEDKYCCTGAFSTKQTCPPTDYSRFFKGKCPDAYSYAYDDASSLITCHTGSDYVIQFCP